LWSERERRNWMCYNVVHDINDQGFFVFYSAQWHVEEECRPGQSNVWCKGSPPLVVPSILNPQCPRPATPISAHNLRKKVPKLIYYNTNCMLVYKVLFSVVWMEFFWKTLMKQALISILFSFFLQTLHVGITLTGATWCPSMESATTSSMASSAVNPVQIQTYNHMEWLCDETNR